MQKRTPPFNHRTELPPDKVKALSDTQLEAYNYLHNKRIFEFFQFLICHLLAEQPDDPVTFLGNLLDRCMMFRSGLAEPPLLFTEKHVKAMYRALDPRDDGLITRQQYENGMKSMNIVGFNPCPEMDQNEIVTKEFFVAEALDCLTRSLAAMLKAGEVEVTPTKWKFPTLDVTAPSSQGEMSAASDSHFPFGLTPSDLQAAKGPHPAFRPGFVRPAQCNVPRMRVPPKRDGSAPSLFRRPSKFMPGYVAPPKPPPEEEEDSSSQDLPDFCKEIEGAFGRALEIDHGVVGGIIQRAIDKAHAAGPQGLHDVHAVPIVKQVLEEITDKVVQEAE